MVWKSSLSILYKGKSHRSSGPKQKRLMWQRWRQQDNVQVCAHTCVFTMCIYYAYLRAVRREVSQQSKKKSMSRCSIWKNSHFKQARTVKNRLIGQLYPNRALRKHPWNADTQFTHSSIHSCIYSTNINSMLGTVLRSGVTEMNKMRSPAKALPKEALPN